MLINNIGITPLSLSEFFERIFNYTLSDNQDECSRKQRDNSEHCQRKSVDTGQRAEEPQKKGY